MLLTLAAYSQTANLNLAVRYQISNPGSTGTFPTFTVAGTVGDDMSRWNATNVQVGDSLYVLNGGQDLAICRVAVINSAIGNALNITVTCVTAGVTSLDPGQAAIIRPTSINRLPTYISGLQSPLQSLILNRQSQLIDRVNIDITSYIGISGVSPAVAASSYTGQIWKNSVGELYGSNGTSWIPVGGTKSCLDTISISGITPTPVLGTPLIRKTLNTWDNISGNNHSDIPTAVVISVSGSVAVIAYCGSYPTALSAGNYYADSVATSGYSTSTTNMRIIRPAFIVDANGFLTPTLNLGFAPISIMTNATLTGNGTSAFPLGLANQGATAGQYLIWNGSAWVPGAASASIATAADDAAIRAGTTAPIGYYVTDTRTAGLFIRVASVLTDNAITIINDAVGNSYRRTENSGDIMLKWAEVQGSWDAVRTAFTLATTVGAKRVILEPVIYLVDKPANNSVGFEVIGNGATLKMIAQKRDTISVGTSGASTITVNQGTRFKIGQQISIITSNTVSGIQNFTGGGATAQITNIVGNVLTLDKTLSASAVGKSVIENNSMSRIQNPGGLKLSSLTIDGNRSNRTGSYAWPAGSLIEANETVICDSVKFKNVVHTCVIGPDVQFTRCFFDSIGVAFHVSSQVLTASLRKPSIIRDCTFRYTGLNYTECVHCEGGMVTYSASGYNITVENNLVYYPRNSLIVPFSADDDHLIFRNNRCYGDANSNATAIQFTQNVGGSVSTDDKADISVTGNIFDRVGNITFGGASVSDRRAYYRLKFKDNVMRNGILLFQSVGNSDISNNLIYFDTAFSYVKHKLVLSNDLDNAGIVFNSDCPDVEFNNNKIYMLSADTSLFLGVMMQRANRFSMKGGQVLGFKIGISTVNTSDDDRFNRPAVFDGVLVEVQGRQTTWEEPRAIGMRISRGNTIRNCIIRAKSAGFNAYPIETTMGSVANSDSVGVFIINNRLESDTNNLVYQTTSLFNSNNSVVMGNYGFSKNASTTPGQTGFAADYYHNTATSNYGNTTFIGNYFWASSRHEQIILTLPTYLNLVRETD